MMKRLVIGGAIAAVLLVAGVYFALDYFLVKKTVVQDRKVAPGFSEDDAKAAFTTPTNTRIPAQYQNLLAAIAEKVRRNRVGEACDFFEPTAVYSQAQMVDLTPALPLPKFIGEQSKLLFPAMVEAFGRGGFGLPWDRLEIANVQPQTGGQEIVLYVRHIAGDECVPVRWWLVQSGKVLVAKDFEDLRTGYRFSQQFAILLGTSLSVTQKSEWQAAALGLRDAVAALASDRPQEASIQLDAAKRANGPDWQNQTILAIEGLIKARLQKSAEAETIAVAMGEKPIASLIRMHAATGPDGLNQRVKAAEKYESAFGPTTQTISLRIQSKALADDWSAVTELLCDGLIRYPESPSLQAWASLIGP